MSLAVHRPVFAWLHRCSHSRRVAVRSRALMFSSVQPSCFFLSKIRFLSMAIRSIGIATAMISTASSDTVRYAHAENRYLHRSTGPMLNSGRILVQLVPQPPIALAVSVCTHTAQKPVAPPRLPLCLWGSFTVKLEAGGARLRQSCLLTHR